MRVKIGDYTGYFGPYQLAEKLCFWAGKEKDKYGAESTPEWVHKFGEWLAYGNIRPDPEVGEVYDLFPEQKPTWLYHFLLWIQGYKKRKIKVHIDRWDTISMYETLGYIIRPMLKDLKQNKYGAPNVDVKDVPKELHGKKLTKKQKDNGEVDDKHFERWDWVLDEMIFAFESISGGSNENWEEQFHSGEVDIKWKKLSNGTSQMVYGDNHTEKFDQEGCEAYAKRIENGFVLFGKYYQSLWS